MTPPVWENWTHSLCSISMLGAVHRSAKPVVFLLLTLAVAAADATDAPASADPSEPFSPMLLWALFVLVAALACIVAAVIIAATADSSARLGHCFLFDLHWAFSQTPIVWLARLSLPAFCGPRHPRWHWSDVVLVSIQWLAP